MAFILVLFHILVMVDAVEEDQNFTVNRSSRAVSILEFISEGDVHRDFFLQILIPAVIGVPALGEVVLAILTECAGTGQCCFVLTFVVLCHKKSAPFRFLCEIRRSRLSVETKKDGRGYSPPLRDLN